MLCINKIYIITTIFNWHRLYNSIRDLRLHFPGKEIQVCIWVDRHNIDINDDGVITTDWDHFGTITQVRLDPENKCWCWAHTNLWCAMSHMNVMKDALDNNYDNILVVEDDLLLGTKAGLNYKMYMEHLPEDRELLRLSWKPYDLSTLKSVNSCWYTLWAWWCEFYMLNKKGIKKFYDFFQSDFYGSTDAQMAKAHHMQIYIAKCPLGIQWNNYDTDNSDTRWNKAYDISKSNKWWYTITWQKSYLKLT